MRNKLESWIRSAFPAPEPPPPPLPYERIAAHPNPLGMLAQAKVPYPHSMPIGVDRHHRMLYSKSQTAVGGVGPARALGGKSAAISIPTLLEHDGPAVVMSLRSDALNASVAIRSLRGTVSMFNPDGLTLPDGVEEVRWSPLVGAEDLDTSLSTWRALIKSAVTINASAQNAAENNHFMEQCTILAGVAGHFAAMTGKDYRWVAPLTRSGNLDNFEAIAGVMSYWEDQRAFEMFSGILNMPGDRERGSILTTLNVALSAYQTEAALRSTDNPNFNADHFAIGSKHAENPWLWTDDEKRPGKGTGDTMYLIAGEQPVSAAINVAIVTQIVEARQRLYRDDEQKGDTDEHPDVLFCLDEMANMPLPQLPMLLAAPGRGCLFTGMLQDFSQLSKWGDAGPSMLTQMQQLLIYRGGRVRDTLQLIESLCPTVPIERVMHSGQRSEGGGIGASASPERLPGIPTYRIYSGIDDDPTTVLFLGADGAPPDWIHIRPYYSDPMYLNAQVKSLWQMAHKLYSTDPRRLLPLPDLDVNGTGSAIKRAGGFDLYAKYRDAVRLLGKPGDTQEVRY